MVCLRRMHYRVFAFLLLPGSIAQRHWENGQLVHDSRTQRFPGEMCTTVERAVVLNRRGTKKPLEGKVLVVKPAMVRITRGGKCIRACHTAGPEIAPGTSSCLHYYIYLINGMLAKKARP